MQKQMKRFLSAGRLPWLLSLCCLWMLAGCGEDQPEVEPGEPFACFEAPAELKAGVQVQFSSACSKNADTYLWEFGTGASSTEANPTYTFTSGGEKEVQLTVFHGDKQHVVRKTIQVQEDIESYIHHSGTISQDESWGPGIHLITNYLGVEGATLTIEPGAIVKFGTYGRIGVGYSEENSTLIAEGTAQHPIIFTSADNNPQDGAFEGINFYEHTTADTRFAYCTFEYGGGQYFGNQEAMIEMKYCTVAFEHCTFRHISQKGILLGYEAGFSRFEHNTLSDIEEYGISILGNYVHTIGEGNQFDYNGIMVQTDRIDQNVRWEKQSCPYYIHGAILIGGLEESTLTIAPGTTLLFGNYHPAIHVGEYQTTQALKGALIAEGTAEEKIIFSSASETPAPGDWHGINFYKGAGLNSSLKHCEINYAGTDYETAAAISISRSRVSIENCRIANAGGNGIIMDKYGYFNSFRNNEIDGPGSYPLNLHTTAVGMIGEGNRILHTEKPVYLGASSLPAGEILWRALDVPYLVYHIHEGPLDVGREGANTVLTIEPGTTIKFLERTGFRVGLNGNGTLIAAGTPEKPIIITSGAEEGSEAPGDWHGMEIYYYTGQGTIFDYCQISYGGSRHANIYVTKTDDGLPVISNCTISHSAYDGIYIFEASPTLINNTFHSNAKEDVR